MNKKFLDTHKRISDKKRIEQYGFSSLENLIEWLQDIKKSFPKEAINFSSSVDIDYTCGYYDDREYYLEVSWNYYVPYTKEELEEKRLDKAKRSKIAREAAEKAKAKKERKELEEFERLRKKFEGK